MTSTSLYGLFPVGTLLQSESGEDIRAGCRALEKGVQDTTFSSLLLAAVTTLVQTPTTSTLTSLSGHPAFSSMPSTAALDCSRTLLALFTDFARCNVSSASASGALEESGLSPGKASTFSSVYATALPSLRESLTALARPPRLIDLSWRLDFLVSSKELGRISRPVYRVSFILEDDGGRRTVDVACSPQELEDLQAKIMSAVQSADALIASAGRQ